MQPLSYCCTVLHTCAGYQLKASRPSVVAASGIMRYAENRWPSRMDGTWPGAPASMCRL